MDRAYFVEAVAMFGPGSGKPNRKAITLMTLPRDKAVRKAELFKRLNADDCEPGLQDEFNAIQGPTEWYEMSKDWGYEMGTVEDINPTVLAYLLGQDR
jgi:hypothetical protein